MGWRRIQIKCSVCENETALIGEDIDKMYTVEHFQAQGWSFTKYKTMCPKCREAEQKRWEAMGKPEQMTIWQLPD